MDFLPKMVETVETKVDIEMDRKGLTILNDSKGLYNKNLSCWIVISSSVCNCHSLPL
jgi:hypothetical protein